MSTAPNWLSISEAAALIATRKLSPLELVMACFAQIGRLEPKLNAFVLQLAESAHADASAAANDLANGRYRGPLHGIPIALKDNVDVAGLPTTAGSRVFLNNVPREDAEVVRRLRAAGAIIIGKTNLHEFAYGGSGLISHFGPVRNPWDTARVTGGSSSGSGTAVAAGMCLAAIGTDTAGSIRLPAALCGIAGLKPTHGRVSIRGIVPLSWSFDHAGPLTRTVRDAALMLDVLAGYDAGDPDSQHLPGPPPAGSFTAACAQDAADLRVGVAREFFFAGLDSEVAAPVEDALRLIRTLVRDVREVALPVDEDRSVSSSESFAYHEPLLPKHETEYDPETLRRIRTGAAITASTYIARRRQLVALRRAAGEHFREVDVIITPTVPIPPPRIDDLLAKPETLRPAELLMLRNTRPFNVLATPALSLPCGFTASGLPVGLQIAAAPGNESTVLRLAHAYEQAAGWSARRPEL